MVLGMLEINLGSVCASVPVFWPVLTAQIGKIFVTQEVTITRTYRSSPTNGRRDDEVELRGHSSATAECDVDGCTRLHSRGDSSDSSESQLEKGEKRSHYQDRYIIGQVDPLSMNYDYIVESEVTSVALKR